MKEFKEVQRFRQWYIWIILIPVLLLMISLFFLQLISGVPVGDNPAPTIMLFIVSMLPLALCIFFYRIKLTTIITDNIIAITYAPFYKKTIPVTDLRKLEFIKYDFVGYGYRISKYGTVLNVSGREGLHLTFKSGKQLLIGTQESQQLKAFVKNSKQLASLLSY